MRWVGASLYQGGTLAYVTARPAISASREPAAPGAAPGTTLLSWPTAALTITW